MRRSSSATQIGGPGRNDLLAPRSRLANGSSIYTFRREVPYSSDEGSLCGISVFYSPKCLEGKFCELRL
jgi:hypothetical protein